MALFIVQESTGCKWCSEFAKQNGIESLVPLAQTIYLMMGSDSLEECLLKLEALAVAENHYDRNMKPLEHGLHCSTCGVGLSIGCWIVRLGQSPKYYSNYCFAFVNDALHLIYIKNAFAMTSTLIFGG